jgi:uncharacterized membrane protein YdbT with pleckstrin-like domain
MDRKQMKWYDRKRIWCGFPWSFTRYGLSDDRFFVEKGFFTTQEMEVRLYRILNVRLSRTLLQKMFGLGSIHIDSSDSDLRSFDVINIKNSAKVKEMLSELVEEQRLKNRVTAREYMTEGDHGHEPGMDDFDADEGDHGYDDDDMDR